MIERYTNAYSRTTGDTIQFSDDETPAGTIDGTNATFTLAYTPSASGSSLRIFLDGVFLRPVTDYTLVGKTLTIDPASIPNPGQSFLAYYRF